jgi:hypothetical protein
MLRRSGVYDRENIRISRLHIRDPPNVWNMSFVQAAKTYPFNRPWRPIPLWDVEGPTFSLDNRLTDGGEVVNLTRQPPFTPQEDSWYSFLLEA